MFLGKNVINLFQDLSSLNVKSKRPMQRGCSSHLKSEWPVEIIKERKLLKPKNTYCILNRVHKNTMLELATVCDAATSLTKVGFRRTELHNESLYLKKFLGLSFSATLLPVEVQCQESPSKIPRLWDFVGFLV